MKTGIHETKVCDIKLKVVCEKQGCHVCHNATITKETLQKKTAFHITSPIQAPW